MVRFGFPMFESINDKCLGWFYEFFTVVMTFGSFHATVTHISLDDVIMTVYVIFSPKRIAAFNWQCSDAPLCRFLAHSENN